MQLEQAYLRVGTWNGAPVRVHFTAPIGIIAFSGFELAPARWLGVALVIFIHEVGHALLVRRCGGTTISIDMTGVGGECHWAGAPGRFARCLIAWGGVAAQGVLLVVASATIALVGGGRTMAARDFLYALTASNVLMGLLNLLPVRPLDGAEAWRIVPLALRRLRPVLRRAYHGGSARVTVRRQERLESGEHVPPLPAEIVEQLRRITEDDR